MTNKTMGGGKPPPQQKEQDMKYALIFAYDNGDPSAYGPFSSVKKAEKRRDEITAKWDDRDWYHAGGGHGITITKLSK